MIHKEKKIGKWCFHQGKNSKTNHRKIFYHIPDKRRTAQTSVMGKNPTNKNGQII